MNREPRTGTNFLEKRLREGVDVHAEVAKYLLALNPDPVETGRSWSPPPALRILCE